MAAFYADENFPLETVEALRRRGHDVLTALEAGQANQGVPDEAVLEYATRSSRILLTLNRWHFVRLHGTNVRHGGILVCSQDPDSERQASAIDAAVAAEQSLQGLLIRGLSTPKNGTRAEFSQPHATRLPRSLDSLSALDRVDWRRPRAQHLAC